MKSNTNEGDLNRIILFNQNIGIIRYVGPILGLNNDSEIWYGVEWKDPSKGKHDGSHMGKRYFQTKHPTGGSFVKPNKCEFGVSIWRAVEEKYYENDDFDQTNNDELLYNNLNSKAKIMRLNCVGLAQSKISNLDNINNINQYLPYLKEIHLEDNMLNSWSQIFDILKAINGLKIINVSNNILPIDENVLSDSNVFNGLTNLIINKMNYNWNDVFHVLKHFPNLTELKCCFNVITEIDKLDQELIEHLKVLDLESNPINEWKNLIQLGEIKQLEILYVNDTRISNIYFDDCDYSSKTKYFPSLKILGLNDNRISDWKSINELNKLKNLTELTLRLNPLNHSDTNENVRQLIIAKIESLKVFNKTQIGNKDNRDERRGAEIDYLKKFAKKWLELNCMMEKSENKEPIEQEYKKFYFEHPRYMDFVKKYGAAEQSETEIKPDILKSSLLTLNIVNDLTSQSMQRKIPSSIEIKRLKVIVCNLFKSSQFETDSMRLFYKTTQNPNNEYELDNDFRQLNFYSLENGDILIARN